MEISELNVNKLVNEMGFDKAEASMALSDSQGDLNQAIEKLLAGEYAPPPYSENQQPHEQAEGGSLVYHSKKSDLNYPEDNNSVGSRLINFFGDITQRKAKVPEVKENPTAPSFYDLTEQLHSLPSTAKQMPPPYQIEEKQKKVSSWEEEFNVYQVQLNNLAQQKSLMGPVFETRCDVCFSILKEREEDILSQNARFYHGQCFRKKFGPKCAHCCFPLSMADKDHDLSGRYLVYQEKDYHVECYEKYAGPRCSQCFNVIIGKPNGEFSGSWIVDGNYQYHTECYERKLQNYWKAKNS